MALPHADFALLIDAGRPTCTLLASHWIALKQVMAPVTEMEFRVRARRPDNPSGDGDASMALGMVRWLRHLNRQVDAAHQGYNGVCDPPLAFFTCHEGNKYP